MILSDAIIVVGASGGTAICVLYCRYVLINRPQTRYCIAARINGPLEIHIRYISARNNSYTVLISSTTSFCPLILEIENEITPLRLILLRRPNHPRNHNHHLHPPRRPQRPRKPNPTMRPQPPHTRAHQQQHRRPNPSIPLHIIPLKQLRIPKQIAIITRQHHTSQPIEPQRPARHRLPAGLERHRGKRDEDLPVQIFFYGVADGDDHCGEGDQERLEEVGGDEDPALFGGEGAVEAGEEEGTEAEGEDGG